MFKKIFNHYYKIKMSNILHKLLTSFFSNFTLLKLRLEQHNVDCQITDFEDKCLQLTYNDKDNYQTLINTVNMLSNHIANVLIKLLDIIDIEKREVEILKDKLNNCVEYHYLNIDESLFNTSTYKNLFKEELTKLNAYNTSNDSKVLLFNTLINEETIYLRGIMDAIDYAKNKKTRSTSIYKQLEKHFLNK